MTKDSKVKKKNKKSTLNKLDKLRIDAEACGKIETLYQQGLKAPAISKQVGLTERQVRLRIKKFLKFGTMEERPRSGRPRCTTEREDRMILYEAEKHPFSNIKEMMNELPDIHISRVTWSNRLKQSHRLVNRSARFKPFLRPHHIKKRYIWAKEHQNWTFDDWKKVLWSDETIFFIFPLYKKRVWRPIGSELKMKYTKPAVAHSAKVIVWGCMSGCGIGEIEKIEGTMNADMYISILKKNFVSVLIQCMIMKIGYLCKIMIENMLLEKLLIF